MFDIFISGCTETQLDVVKAYFILHNRVYEHRNGQFWFYADKVNDLFELIADLSKFYDEHRPKGYRDSLDFRCGINDDGNYYIDVIDYDY
jgi:hypothetical protein